MFATPNEDLVSLINCDRLSSDVFNPGKSLKFFNHCLSKSIVEIYLKFSDLNLDTFNLDEAILAGSNMVYHVFWFLMGYTYNLQLTVFFVERAILLFIEFIIISRNPEMNQDLYFLPNINDAISFSYRKTIGPIKGDLDPNVQLNKIRRIANDLKFIVQQVFLFLISHKEKEKRNKINKFEPESDLSWEAKEKIYLQKSLEEILNYLYPSLYNLYFKCPTQTNCPYLLWQDILTDITHDNLIIKIQLIKLLTDNIIDCYNNNSDWNITVTKMRNVYQEICNLESLDYQPPLYYPIFPKLIRKKKLFVQIRKLFLAQ